MPLQNQASTTSPAIAAYWGGRRLRVNAVTFAGVFNNQIQSSWPRQRHGAPWAHGHANEYNGAIVYLRATVIT
jgi:hypothetical protein